MQDAVPGHRDPETAEPMESPARLLVRPIPADVPVVADRIGPVERSVDRAEPAHAMKLVIRPTRQRRHVSRHLDVVDIQASRLPEQLGGCGVPQ